ncbi:unnamed protein product [Linum trigynum]|uniref:Uncharacterized protein n=1 Tax=Linum trigynum TaxID=586398 RepID=A0AAV2F3L1_9ROSI
MDPNPKSFPILYYVMQRLPSISSKAPAAAPPPVAAFDVEQPPPPSTSSNRRRLRRRATAAAPLSLLSFLLLFPFLVTLRPDSPPLRDAQSQSAGSCVAAGR